ncbi:MAG: MerR family transcriptional regulator [Roseovarius sp.]
MAKSADAFRTISEVADWLETPAHVLRFWESKFSQVKPVKRAGGRRYYRPADMKLLGGIKKLLHDDGMTIKGVQKMLREQGVGHVSAFSQPLGDAADDVTIDHVEEVPQTGAPPEPDFASTDAPATPASDPASPAPSIGPVPDPTPQTPQAEPETLPLASSEGPVPDPVAAAETLGASSDTQREEPPAEASSAEETALTFSRHKPDPDSETQAETPPADTGEETPPLPSFLQRRDASGVPPAVQAGEAAPSDDAEAAPPPMRPQNVDVPADPGDDLAADPGVLSRISKLPNSIPPELVPELESLLSRLRSAGGSAAGT